MRQLCSRSPVPLERRSCLHIGVPKRVETTDGALTGSTPRSAQLCAAPLRAASHWGAVPRGTQTFFPATALRGYVTTVRITRFVHRRSVLLAIETCNLTNVGPIRTEIVFALVRLKTLETTTHIRHFHRGISSK